MEDASEWRPADTSGIDPPRLYVGTRGECFAQRCDVPDRGGVVQLVIQAALRRRVTAGFCHRRLPLKMSYKARAC